MGVLSLEDLLKKELVDPNIYGQKTAGLIKLYNPLVKFLKKNGKEEGKIQIPDLYAVPVDINLNDPSVREAYESLTSNFSEPKIIMARSSDPDEKPGIFESHTSLYNPNDFENSFKSWIDAAQKVKNSGARALLGQVLAANLSDFKYDYDWAGDEDGDFGEVMLRVKSFGGTNNSFILNSKNIFNKNGPMMYTTFGLPSKLVNGTKEASLIQISKSHGYHIVNLDHFYHRNSLAEYSQESIDLILFDNPDKIITHNYELSPGFEGIGLRSIYYDQIIFPALDRNYFDIDFAGDSYVGRVNSFIYMMFNLVDKLKNEFGREIEIEGTINEDGIYILQMREYETPKVNFKDLTKVPEDKILLSNEKGAYGFNSFSGNIYISNKKIDVSSDDIFMYIGKDVSEINVDNFKDYKKLILLSPDMSHHYRAMTHEFGLAMQTLVELEKKGVDTIMTPLGYRKGGNTNKINKIFDENYHKKIDENTILLEDVTAECDGNDFQIYKK